MGSRIFRHETFAAYNRRAYQRHTPCNGSHRGFSCLWRKAQFMAMDRCLACNRIIFHAQPQRQKEGIDFKHDHWIWMIVGAAVLGAISGLYDKYLMAPESSGGVGLDKMMVQSWYNIYQCFMMGIMMMILWWPKRKSTTPFHWDWSIIFVSIFLSTADFVYFYSLSQQDAMISIVSMIRRGSVIVSFLIGAIAFHEKNLKSKFIDLTLVILGMIFLYIGSR